MSGYADVEDPVALLNRAPDTSGGPTVEDAVKEAGFQVQAVDWVWRKVVGESLVDSIIKPITGDFEKIAEQAAQWKNVCDALQAVRNNLNAGLGELAPAWEGDSAQRFSDLISNTWTLGIEADAQAANLIGFALNKVADGSKRACDQALNLIKTLVDKLIQAAAMLPIPVVGWARAVKLVYDGIQIYNAIMRLIDGIMAIIEGAQQVIQGVQQVGTALSKIKDVNNLNDALNVANDVGEGAANVKGGVDSAKGGIGDVKDGATSAASAGSSAKDNASGLRDERAAARDNTGNTNDGPGGTTPNGQRPGDGKPGSKDDPVRPKDPNDTKTPLERRECKNDPIDVATGEMVLGQTDVALPGALPLVLKRTHVSSYRAGRSFGRSWASTVDQRLVADTQGIVFVAEDGMLLAYPVPSVSGETMPLVGPRWPLERIDGGFRITQREAGRFLHFAGAGDIQPLTAILDRNGNRIDFDRDASGTATAVRHSGGYHVEVDNVDGRTAGFRLRNLGGADVPLIRFGYDNAGRLTQVVNSSDQALRFDYDAAGRITQWTDRNDEWYRYIYDEQGRCVANQGSGGFLNGTFGYEERATRFTDSLGATTTYLFDERKNIVAETDPLGNTITREWDANDRLLRRTDPLGHTATRGYDADGNLVTATMPDGTQALAQYNGFGQPTVNIDPDGGVWRQEYDERGNLVAATDPAGATTRYLRDERGTVIGRTDPLGNTVAIECDPRGLPVAITTALGATTRYHRDLFGRLTSIVDPLGGTVRHAWTVEGKPLSRTYADGRVERWRYDSEGAQVEHVDVLGQVTRTETTHFDLVSATIDPTGARTEFAYDTNLRLTSVTDPQGAVWHYEYDTAGNLVRERDFAGRTVDYRHDGSGDLVERSTSAGQSMRFVRDVMGRVVEQHAIGGPGAGADVSTFEFDEAGRVRRAVNQDAELTISRDRLGRVLTETVNGATMTFQYDASGRVVNRRTPTGAQSTWTYDQNGRAVRLDSGGRVMAFDYDPLGREIERLLDTGTRTSQAWDVSHRMLSQTVTGGAGPVQRRRFHYRQDNHLTAIEDDRTGIRRFALDPVGRVTGVDAGAWRERYAYDGSGNLITAQSPAEPAPGAPHTGGDAHHTYDGHGRVVIRQRKRLSRKADTWHYVWDAQDRLIGATTPDGARWRYRYDPLGRRIAKQLLDRDGSVVEQTTFSWHGTELAEQVHSSGQAITWDFDGNFRPVTQIERVRTADQGWVDARFYSIVTDLIGTPTELIDPQGNLAWRGQSTVWGEAIGRLNNQADTPLRFPGQYHDPETGLNYNHFRHYDPANASYVSRDPLGLRPQINPYGYVLNPFKLMDPLGLMTCQEAENILNSTDPQDPAHAQRRSEAWNQLYVGEEREKLARQVGPEIRRDQAPRELAGGRVDAPQAHVPGSQYHVQGPNTGDPGLNLDGTYHDGDPGWSRKTYEYLYDHGWAWPKENPPSGQPPTHRQW